MARSCGMANIVPFYFDTQEVRVYIDEAGDPWWEAQNICGVIGIHDVSKAVARLRSREKRSESRNLLIINESGLYRLIMRSNKTEAQRFQDWVCEEVLPAIRKTGKFDLMSASSLDRHPDLRATANLLLGLAEARDIAEAAKLAADEANANANRALETQLFFTVAEYVYKEKLATKIPESAYRACSDFLRCYCEDRNIPFRRIPVGGKRWDDEYGFHHSVYAEALPGWIAR